MKANHFVIVLALLLLAAGVFVQLTQADVKKTHDLQIVTLDVSPSDTTANGRSNVTDTFALVPTVTTGSGQNWNGFYGDFFLGAGHTTARGVGNVDSVYLRLLAGREKRGVVIYRVIAADSCLCPCSLHVAKPAAVANDTLFQDALFLQVIVNDSSSDSTFNVNYPLYMDYRFYNLK